MKKFLCVILSLLIVSLAFAGCGKNDVQNENLNNDVITDNANDDVKIEENKENDNEPSKETNKEETKKPSKEENVKPIIKEEDNTPQKTEISLSSLASQMVGVIPSEQHNLELIPEELYKDIYGVDKSLFADCVIYGTMISVKANEIIVLKVNDEKDISKATEILEARKNQVYKTWEQYLPDQFEMVKQGIIKINGKYAALIISPLTTRVADKFTELTK